MSTHDGQPTLPLPAPRHLHRKPFRADIPDRMFVAVDVPEGRPRTPGQPVRRPEKTRTAKREQRPVEPRHKRMVALFLVIATVVTVPALVLALLLFS